VFRPCIILKRKVGTWGKVGLSPTAHSFHCCLLPQLACHTATRPSPKCSHAHDTAISARRPQPSTHIALSVCWLAAHHRQQQTTTGNNLHNNKHVLPTATCLALLCEYIQTDIQTAGASLTSLPSLCLAASRCRAIGRCTFVEALLIEHQIQAGDAIAKRISALEYKLIGGTGANLS
jgi:hypothetical protein